MIRVIHPCFFIYCVYEKDKIRKKKEIVKWLWNFDVAKLCRDPFYKFLLFKFGSENNIHGKKIDILKCFLCKWWSHLLYYLRKEKKRIPLVDEIYSIFRFLISYWRIPTPVNKSEKKLFPYHFSIQIETNIVVSLWHF